MFIIKVDDIEKFWGDKVPIMACEELGELITAISHRERGRIDNDQVAAEIADVLISCGMLMTRYKISEELLTNKLTEKTNRKY